MEQQHSAGVCIPRHVYPPTVDPLGQEDPAPSCYSTDRSLPKDFFKLVMDGPTVSPREGQTVGRKTILILAVGAFVGALTGGAMADIFAESPKSE